jgi:MFS family permease
MTTDVHSETTHLVISTPSVLSAKGDVDGTSSCSYDGDNANHAMGTMMSPVSASFLGNQYRQLEEPVRQCFDSHSHVCRQYLPLLVCILLGLVSGSLYGFGRYSRDLKDHLGLTQTQMELLGVLLDSGNYIGHPIMGWTYDHFGSRVSCLIAAMLVFVSYGMIHLRVLMHEQNQHSDGFETYHLVIEREPSYTYPPHNWILLGGSFFLVGMGSGLGYMSALGSTTKMFSPPDHLGKDNGNSSQHHQGYKKRRSLAVGIVAAGYGLSSSLVGISYSKVGIDHFFLLWAVLVAIVNILGAMILPGGQSHHNQDHRHDHHYHRVEDDMRKLLRKSSSSFDDEGSCSSTTDEEIALQPLHHNNPENDQDIQHLPLTYQYSGPAIFQNKQLQNQQHNPQCHRLSASYKEELWILEQTSHWQSWKTSDFWLLFVAFCGCTGCGLFIINNVSTMVQSLGGTDRLAGRLVILLSLCNCLGRIGMGILADRAPSKLGLFTLSSAVMAVGMLLSALASDQYALLCLVGTVAVVACSYGGTWVLIVGLLADWFGQDHFGKNYGLMAMGPALSGMTFNAMSAWQYSTVAEGEVHHGVVSSSSGLCLGTGCYHGTFVLTSCAAMVCMVLFYLLQLRRQGSAGPSTNT